MLNLSHKNLDVYKLSLKLLEEVYKATKLFPKEEIYVLVAQLRRAAISVCSNLAEGAARISKAEKKRFYEISRSSLVEIDTQFEIALLQQFVKKEQIAVLEKYLESVFRMLSKMIDNLRLNPTGHSPAPTTVNENSLTA
jgi:four helix bundle protein